MRKLCTAADKMLDCTSVGSVRIDTDWLGIAAAFMRCDRRDILEAAVFTVFGAASACESGKCARMRMSSCYELAHLMNGLIKCFKRHLHLFVKCATEGSHRLVLLVPERCDSRTPEQMAMDLA